MPNHVLNIVRINGEKKELQKFAKKHINKMVSEDGHRVQFSFNTIIPKPKSLEIESGSRIKDAIKYIKGNHLDKRTIAIEYGDKLDELIKLGKTALSNQKKYGYYDWYLWSINNWGTKWDCYEVTTDVFEDEIYIEFQTAWNTPMGVFEAITQKYPKLSISVNYADEDLGNNCGVMEFKGGEQIYDESCNYEFARDLWGF